MISPSPKVGDHLWIVLAGRVFVMLESEKHNYVNAQSEMQRFFACICFRFPEANPALHPFEHVIKMPGVCSGIPHSQQRKSMNVNKLLILRVALLLLMGTGIWNPNLRGVEPGSGIYLDEVQDRAYAASGLYGNESVEEESKLPVKNVAAEPCGEKINVIEPRAMSLAGEWLMRDSEHFELAKTLANRGEESKALEAGWYEPEFDRSDWYKVQVPTSVQSALLKLGLMQDPYWNANTYDELIKYGTPKELLEWHRRLTRIEQHDWWFAKSFTVPAAWKGTGLRLYFDGIDYAGSIYLNGKPLGYHAGMFGGPVRDVTGMVSFDKPNCLVVRVDRIPEISWWDGVLKGSAGWGWNYGHLISLGIWRDVRIEVSPRVEVSAPYVTTKSIEGKKAVLQIEYDVNSQETDLCDLNITGSITGSNFKSMAVRFANAIRAPSGRSRYRTEVIIDDAHPWWPLNYGDPNLYKLDLTLCQGDKGKPVAMNTVFTTFGIRTIEMRPATGATPGESYRWQFVINGEPMFIKGANWCWSDPMLECNPAKYERLLELARRAGIQMFRSWGGGIIETDEYYRLCDEKGLMVYQEFPFNWGPADFPRTDPVVEDEQVVRIVKRLRNHPSLVMWGGGNENGGNAGTDEALLLAGKRCRQFDQSRPFHRTDPWGGSTHNYRVYHEGLPIDRGYQAMPSVWYGEYGLPSMTNLSSMKRYLPEETIHQWPPSPDDPGINAHMNNFSLRDMVKNFRYCDYGPLKSWADYVEYSQMAQGDWLRFAAEGQRASSGAGKTGVWFYKFSDLFPCHAWSVVDFYGCPKLSYYRAKQTYKPQCAFAVYDKLDWPNNQPFSATLHVSNDTPKPFTGAGVTATIYSSDLKPVWNKEYAVGALDPNQRLELETINVPMDPARSKPFLLAVTMRDGLGKLISDQWYWMNFQAKDEAMNRYGIKNLDKMQLPDIPKAFDAYMNAPEARLLSLPRTTLGLRRVQNGRIGRLVIKNNGTVPAFNVIVDHFPEGWNDFLDDNSFSLRPNEQREVAFELESDKTLNGIAVRAWNAPAVNIHESNPPDR